MINRWRNRTSVNKTFSDWQPRQDIRIRRRFRERLYQRHGPDDGDSVGILNGDGFENPRLSAQEFIEYC